MSESNFAIIVTVTVKPGTTEVFKTLILENAHAAVRDEPGCHQFQVLIAEDGPETFFFYEVYENAEALETHRQQPHYLKFIDEASDLIVERSIQRCAVIKA